MKEKTADKMFEELGYEIIKNNKTTLNYEKEGLHLYKEIVFALLDKSAKVGKIVFSYRNDKNHQVMGLEKKELQAINKKVEELGWMKQK